MTQWSMFNHITIFEETTVNTMKNNKADERNELFVVMI